MADGTVIRTGGKNVKDVAGYSLTHLIVGQPGHARRSSPRRRSGCGRRRRRARRCSRSSRRSRAPGEAVAGIAAAGLSPGDARAARPVHDRRRRRHERPRAGPDAAAMLMVESDMPGVAADRRAGARRGRLPRRPAPPTSSAPPTPRRPTGCARPGGWRTTRSSASARSAWRTSACRGRGCRTCSARSSAIAAKHDVRIGTFGHAGDGNLHPDLVLERDDPNGRGEDRGRPRGPLPGRARLGGTVTGEHGIGVARRDWLEHQRGPDAVRVMRAIKDALDPLGILNPGRVI